MDWLDLLAVPGTSPTPQESSPTPQFKSINYSALSFLYSPTLTSIHNHWTTMEVPVQFRSVIQSRPALRDHTDCSMPGCPVHHHFQRLLKLMSIESVMPSNHLILCCPLLFLPSVFPSIRVFSVSQFFTSGGQRIGVSP